MAKHSKIKPVERARGKIESALLKMPLPNANPNAVSGLSILMSLLFVLVFRYNPPASFAILFLVLALDLLDGLIAKKHYMPTEEGYIVDVASDRLSEGIIFSVFFTPWFYLFALNNILTLWSFSSRKHVILPLRHAFLLYFLPAFVV
ncbi:MAG: CDP-alcohol phosphatidyltransferase family protein [Candidatus Aenigmarchaeota archaeon]|nr:CDP-alcohol phosphatidyltransferase family protein [Candidatus Aenigmarchaeota archaeon]